MPATPPQDSPVPEQPRSRRGFASMDPARLRAVSSKGGSAPHTTAKRGFALMDENRRKEVSRKGGKSGKAPPDAIEAEPGTP